MATNRPARRPKSKAQILQVSRVELEKLRSRLEEAEAILEAIREGEVEALVVNGAGGDQVFTLKGADHSYRVFVEAMSEGAVTLGDNGVVLYCNRRFAEMVQTPLEEVIGSFFQQYLPKDSHERFDRVLRDAQAMSRKEEFQLKRTGGTALSASLSLTRFEGNDLKTACLVVTDLSQQKLAQERLSALSHRLLEVQESERRHLARELHDEIGQILTGLKITLETNCYLAAGGAPIEAFQRARDQVEDLLKRVQDISLDLRPAMLDDLGLLPALLWHFERYKSQTSIRVKFRHSGLRDRRFTPETETAAYRLVQEGLTNVARHAGVAEVDVYIHAGLKALVIQIEDSGKGFDVQQSLSSRTSSGLTGMQERAALMGGELLLRSVPGKGTQLRAKLPFDSLTN